MSYMHSLISAAILSNVYGQQGDAAAVGATNVMSDQAPMGTLIYCHSLNIADIPHSSVHIVV